MKFVASIGLISVDWSYCGVAAGDCSCCVVAAVFFFEVWAAVESCINCFKHRILHCFVLGGIGCVNFF